MKTSWNRTSNVSNTWSKTLLLPNSEKLKEKYNEDRKNYK